MGSPASTRPALSEPFTPIYRAHAARVRHAVRLAGVAWRDVPDVVQEVFIDLHDAMTSGRLDVARPLGGWLYTVSCRRARKFLALAHHQNERITIADAPLDPPVGARSPEDIADVHEIVYALLDELPADQRLVLVMKRVEGMEMHEIASKLEIPLDTGFSRLRAAEKKLKTAWDARRRSGAPALLPFAAWSAEDLLTAVKRTIPELPEGFEESVLRSLVARLGDPIKKRRTVAAIAIGALVSVLLGAGFYVLLARRVAIEAHVFAMGATTAIAEHRPSFTATVAPVALASVTATASAPPRRAESTESAERVLLEGARTALANGNIPSTLAALDQHARRYPHGHLAPERETLRAYAMKLNAARRGQEDRPPDEK